VPRRLRGSAGPPCGQGAAAKRHFVPGTQDADHHRVHFCAQLLFSCRDAYAAQLARLALPVDEEQLQKAHNAAAEAAYSRWEKEKFGGGRSGGATTLWDALSGAIDKEFE
jgi:hypothetical protein